MFLVCVRFIFLPNGDQLLSEFHVPLIGTAVLNGMLSDEHGSCLISYYVIGQQGDFRKSVWGKKIFQNVKFGRKY